MKGKVANTDGRVPTLNAPARKDKEGNTNISGRGRGAGAAVTDPEEARNDLINRHARGFMRDVQKRSKGIHKKRND